MSALAKAKGRRLPRTALKAKRLSEHEPVNGKPRKMVGLFVQLSTEQKDAVLAYCGPENHGDSRYLKK